MRINGGTYGKLKTPLKVNGNLNVFFFISVLSLKRGTSVMINENDILSICVCSRVQVVSWASVVEDDMVI